MCCVATFFADLDVGEPSGSELFLGLGEQGSHSLSPEWVQRQHEDGDAPADGSIGLLDVGDDEARALQQLDEPGNNTSDHDILHD